MASESSEIGLPPEAAVQAAPEATQAAAPAVDKKAGILSKLMFWKRSAPAVHEGPIPGVTPATPDQLFSQSGPKVSLEAEQADLTKQEIKSAQKVA